MSYDRRCYELAEAFLEDVPKLAHRKAELAQAIQTAIEEWIEEEESK